MIMRAPDPPVLTISPHGFHSAVTALDLVDAAPGPILLEADPQPQGTSRKQLRRRPHGPHDG